MQALTDIGNFFSSPAGKAITSIGSLGATGAGLVGNILGDRQRADAAAMAKRNANLTPQQLAQMVSQGTAPLNANLVRAITQNVNANLAEQGLSQAPGLIATATSQALAPYEQQNQQTALDLVLRKLGLPGEYSNLIPPNAQLAPGIALLMKQLASFPGAVKPAAFPTTGPTPEQAGAQSWNLGDWGNLIPTDTTGVSS